MGSQLAGIGKSACLFLKDRSLIGFRRANSHSGFLHSVGSISDL